MQICFVCGEYPPGPHGGIGTCVQVLARELASAGHGVRVVGVCRHGYPAPDRSVDRGVQVWRLRSPRHRLGWIKARWQLYRVIARWARLGMVDLVEVPDYEGWAAGWPSLPVPVVARLNGSSSYFAREMGRPVRRRTFWLERASLLRADCWCSVSRYTAEKTQRLFRLPTGPQAVLSNPVEEACEADFCARVQGRAVFTGTLAVKKGILSLAAAWPEVVRQCPHAELHVYGKDGRTDEGRSMQEQLRRILGADAGNTVQFHGHVGREQVFSALASASVAVFPSYAEALALAPLEAMVRGCPTIATLRGSGPELIQNGRDGLLVDPDRPDQIARAIVRLLSDRDLARRLGENGRARVLQDFSVGGLLSRNEEFYRQCVNRFAGTRSPWKVQRRDNVSCAP